MTHPPTKITRRRLLATSAAGAVTVAGGLAAPALAQTRSIKIGSYGGFFEDSFKAHVYPAFTAATGIEVESITQPDSTGWLLTMQQAIAAGNVPADLSMHVPINILKGDRLGGIFQPLDGSRIANLDKVNPNFINEGAAGLSGVGALSYFTSLVINTEQVDKIESWTEIWDTDLFEASLGVPKQASSPIWDITAHTFFGGGDVLQTQDGIREVIAKIAELGPNVALWYNAESQMEQALKNFDVVAGLYYHDVAGLMAADGLPIASLFPKEGNPVDFNSWTLAQGSTKSDEAHEFINFSSEPSTQATMARMIGVAPVVDRSLTDLTDEEFAGVAGDPVIPLSYQVMLDNETFMEEEFNKMLASSG